MHLILFFFFVSIVLLGGFKTSNELCSCMFADKATGWCQRLLMLRVHMYLGSNKAQPTADQQWCRIIDIPLLLENRTNQKISYRFRLYSLLFRSTCYLDVMIQHGFKTDYFVGNNIYNGSYNLLPILFIVCSVMVSIFHNFHSGSKYHIHIQRLITNYTS